MIRTATAAITASVAIVDFFLSLIFKAILSPPYSEEHVCSYYYSIPFLFIILTKEHKGKSVGSRRDDIRIPSLAQ